jgi:hypothetical protein
MDIRNATKTPPHIHNYHIASETVQPTRMHCGQLQCKIRKQTHPLYKYVIKYARIFQ